MLAQEDTGHDLWLNINKGRLGWQRFVRCNFHAFIHTVVRFVSNVIPLTSSYKLWASFTWIHHCNKLSSMEDPKNNMLTCWHAFRSTTLLKMRPNKYLSPNWNKNSNLKHSPFTEQFEKSEMFCLIYRKTITSVRFKVNIKVRHSTQTTDRN